MRVSETTVGKATFRPLPLDRHGLDDVALRGPVGLVAAAEEDGTAGIRAIEILVELHPQAVEGAGAVVRVGDRLGGRDGLRHRIEPGREGVVGAVLPIVRAGRPVGRTEAVDGFGEHNGSEGLARVESARRSCKRRRRRGLALGRHRGRWRLRLRRGHGQGQDPGHDAAPGSLHGAASSCRAALTSSAVTGAASWLPKCVRT